METADKWIDNAQGPREDIFYATLDVFGEPYNRDVFNGDPYQAIDGHVYDWRGVEVERSWLIDRMDQCNDKNNHRMQQLERSESAYRDLERNYNKQVHGECRHELGNTNAVIGRQVTVRYRCYLQRPLGLNQSQGSRAATSRETFQTGE